METAIPLLGTMLFLSFAICCTASALLQVVAWWRHRRGGTPVHVGALWKPEGYFDAVGLQQMRLARRLILIGVVMYLSYGVLMLVAARVNLSR
jgi:hypothetical protein